MSAAAPTANAPLWTPRHWPAWLLLGAMWCAAQLPHPLRLALGRLVGALLYRLTPRRAAIARTNFTLCFPQLDDEAREALVRRTFAALGMSLIEIGMGWWTPRSRLEPLLEIRGLEHITGAGRGVIALTAHFSAWEIGARLLSLHTPIAAIYRPHENPVIEWAMCRYRSRNYGGVIPRDDVRAMVRHLKAGGVVWYAQDQNYGHKGSLFAEFFGIPAATNTATSRLARMGDAAVVPFAIRRTARGYLLEIEPPLEGFPGDDPQRDTQRINDFIEAAVRRAPEQYNWIHRRFKDRPAGEERFY